MGAWNGDNSNDHLGRISELENARAALFQRCGALEEEVGELEYAKSLLEERVSELEADNLDLIDRAEKLADELERAEATIEQLKRVKNLSKESQSGKIEGGNTKGA